MVALMKKTNPSFLNGIPELLVLRLLAGREMYGYQIVEEIRAQSGEAFTFGEGCITPICITWKPKNMSAAAGRRWRAAAALLPAHAAGAETPGGIILRVEAGRPGGFPGYGRGLCLNILRNYVAGSRNWAVPPAASTGWFKRSPTTGRI